MTTEQEFWEALTLYRKVDKDGNVFWYNSDGERHRDNGPAIEYADGRKVWYQNGKRLRDNVWYQNGKQQW